MYLSIYRSISLSLFHLSLCLASKRGRRPPVFNTFDFRMCFAPQRRALFRHLDFQKWSGPGVFCTFWLGNVLRATTACTFSTSQLRPPVFYTFDLEMCFAPQRRALFRHLNFQKWSENGVFCTFWLGNVLRATTACTFSTSQLPKVHFDLEMCFAPQRRALFQHLNSQKWSEAEVFCTFWLGNVLRATTACTFSTSQLPKVVRTWCVLDILTWKCASRHNGVQFFISHLASWLRTRRFSEPTFRASGATNHWKNTATFLPFRASASSFFWLFLFSDLLSSNLSLLSPSALLCFSSVHIVGSLTSKLPSIMYIYIYIGTLIWHHLW